MGRYFSLLIVLLGALAQSTVVPELRIGESAPDLVLLLALSWALLAGLSEGLLWAAFGGILQDLLSGLPTGTTALALLAAVMSAHLIGGVRRNLLIASLVAALGTLVYHGTLFVLLIIVRRPVEIGYALRQVTLPNMFFNAAAMLVVFLSLRLLHAAFYPRRLNL
ncbi:MAG: rod shape-determining protein MreD [Aggregatilineales bacterium]